MKSLLVLLSVVLVVLPCSAAPALEPVTCGENGGGAAARLAMHHINENHHHGYKFKLSEILSSRVEQGLGECNVMLELSLQETQCHTINPEHFEDCEIRAETDTQVTANCNVVLTIKDGVANVTKYDCETKRALTSQELVRLCPDCPQLLPLNNTEGLKSVRLAVEHFNKNTTNQRYYTLLEVGRMSSGYMMMAGMAYFAEIALVETHCPMGSRIVIEACKPLCPDRAHHALCDSSYVNEEISIECKFYTPANTTSLEPGQQEPRCPPPHASGQGPPPHLHPRGGGLPPHASGQGPPPHASGQGPPPHAKGHGPPPHARGHGPPPHAHPEGVHPPPFNSHHPFHTFHTCHVGTTSDQALHPICNWPRLLLSKTQDQS
ncbi:HSF-like protein [Polymixia lowei]